VVKNKSGSGSKQGQGSKKPAKPRAKPSFPGPVLPGSAEEARLLGERDPNLDDELRDISEVRPTDMRYARGSGESDKEDVPVASEDEDDPAYDPSSGEESGMRQAAPGLLQILLEGRLATHLHPGALLPKGRATDLLLWQPKAVSSLPARGFIIVIHIACF
jgi:hypothetical protein